MRHVIYVQKKEHFVFTSHLRSFFTFEANPEGRRYTEADESTYIALHPSLSSFPVHAPKYQAETADQCSFLALSHSNEKKRKQESQKLKHKGPNALLSSIPPGEKNSRNAVWLRFRPSVHVQSLVVSVQMCGLDELSLMIMMMMMM